MGYFVPARSIENLKYYKYQSEDKSIVTKYFLKPFWNNFVEVFPVWMAPNLITLSGLGFILVNVSITLYYDPNLNQDLPRWVYLANALGLFMYQTFDGCDGVHARRISQSSPLGELFDHSIDAINTTLCLFIFSSTLRLGYSYKMIYSQFAALTTFYLSTWEEYHTHTLFLAEMSGPVEGILAACIAYVFTAILGPEFVWHTKLFNIIWKDEVIGFETCHVVLVFTSIGIFANCYTARKNVVDYYKKDKILLNTNSEIKTSLKGLVPYVAYMISVTVLIIVEKRFITFPFILSIGLAVAFVVGRIIVNHLTKQPYPMSNVSLFIPITQLIVYLFMTRVFHHDTIETVLALAWLGFGLALGIHALFMNEIIYEFTKYLDVYALSIKHPKFV